MIKMCKRIAVCVGVLLISACANRPEGPSNAEIEYAKFSNKTTHQEIEVPDEVNEALMSSAVSVPYGRERAAQVKKIPRFDVSVSRVPAKVFFVSLVSETGVNVVAHPEIEGDISLTLSDVSIEEVLSVVRDVYGYEYKLESGIYTIYPRKLRTQIFPINYIDVQRTGVTDTSVTIGNITSSSSSDSSNSSNSSSSNDENSEYNSRGTRVKTVNETDFWGQLQTSLLGIVGGQEDGRFVMTNSQTGMVVVRALPSELSVIREFLDKSELSVQRQVILETKILEVQLNDQYQTGINWSAISGGLGLENNISGTGSINSVLGNKNLSEVIYSSAVAIPDITKLINLLDQQGDVSVLSSPRISTVNNQKAIIRVGSDEFFVTGISNSTTSGATSVTTTPEVILTSFFSGISLDITPQIGDQGDVILHVHPIVSKVEDQLKEFQVGDDNFSLPLAFRDIRESDSIVKASSGQVVVLGGLMQESSSDVLTKRGVLGDIPVLNLLFKYKEKTLNKTELVILMRPIVIDDDSWDQQVQNGKIPFGDFGREE